MAKSKKRTTLLSMKARVKEGRMKNPGEKSNYARKAEFLKKHGGWGFEYQDKPWK